MISLLSGRRKKEGQTEGGREEKKEGEEGKELEEKEEEEEVETKIKSM